MEETFIKDKVVTTEVRNVDVDPFKIIIYATLDITKKDGVELYFNTKSKFHVNTTPYSFEKGDVTIEAIPFVNIARMTIEELNNSELDFKQLLEKAGY